MGVIKVLIVLLITLFILTKTCKKQDEKHFELLQELAGFQPDQKVRRQQTLQARGDEDDKIKDKNEDGCTSYVEENSLELSKMASRPRALNNKKHIKSDNGNKINLIRHVEKNEESPFKYIPSENYNWGINEDGLKNAENLGIYFYYKYENSKIPLIYTSPFLRCIQTALPIAKALNTKLRIEYGLFDPFHGFPSKQEIEEFYKGSEDYIDETYESEINDISTFFEGGDLYKSTIVDNKTNGSNRHNIYENQRTMANYLTKVQKEKNVDIIVVSHQQEMNEIGSFLENPKRRTRNNGHDVYSSKDRKNMINKWYPGRIVEFKKNMKNRLCFPLNYKKYTENKKLYVHLENNDYGLTKKDIENFQEMEFEINLPSFCQIALKLSVGDECWLKNYTQCKCCKPNKKY